MSNEKDLLLLFGKEQNLRSGPAEEVLVGVTDRRRSDGEKMSDVIFAAIMKRKSRLAGGGGDNVRGTDNKQRKLQAGGCNGLSSGEMRDKFMRKGRE